MTTPELITDDIVDKAIYAYDSQAACRGSNEACFKAAILAIQDDITRPYRNLLEGWKQNSEAYERALKEIRQFPWSNVQEIADAALKGDYHKTDFTEFCEQNPITEHPS